MPKLTKTLVDNIQAPEKGDSWVWDSELEGFGVRTQASGRKTYVVRYRVRDDKRTQRKMTVCRCSDMAPDKAREQARKVFSQVAMGFDPLADRRPRQSSESTVENMFKGYIASMVEKGRSSHAEVERVLLRAGFNAADSFGRDREASSVTPEDVIGFVSGFYTRGHRGAADKARSYIASAFSWAISSANDYTVKNRQEWGIKRNPAADVAKDQGATSARDRNLSADELTALWLATYGEGFSVEVGSCIRLIIACGQRVKETLRLCGSEVDIASQTWNMPACKTKGKKHAHSIPLPDVIMPTIINLIELHGEGQLFPARPDSDISIIQHASVNQAIKRWIACGSGGIQDFQTRDLRRTWKSRAHDAGVDRFTRDLIQQHAQSDTGSKNYDRADYLPQMRTAMVKWSAWLSCTFSGSKPPQQAQSMLKLVS